MPEKLIMAPVLEPISLDDAKEHLRVTFNAEDALISSLVGAARDLCERETGRALMPQTWELSLDRFCDFMKLGRAPVISIESIKYTDVDGDDQTLPDTDYILDNAGEYQMRVVLAPNKSWPAVSSGINNVRIRYVAGYPAASAVPKALKQWMLLQISHWYRNRESVNVGNITSTMPFVDILINSYRIYTL